MHHSVILKLATMLTLALVAVAFAFGWATTFREQRLAASERSANGGTGERQGLPVDGKAAFETRCTQCHELADLTDWFEGQSGADPEGDLLEFLGDHGKATASENPAIAGYLRGLASKVP
jgi:mono/diheme cytochrome c family protein